MQLNFLYTNWEDHWQSIAWKKGEDEEKLTKALRAKDIPNLQVPKVVLWRQWKLEIRAVAFQMRKANINYSQALIPVVKAIADLKEKEYQKAGECI